MQFLKDVWGRWYLWIPGFLAIFYATDGDAWRYLIAAAGGLLLALDGYLDGKRDGAKR